MFDFKLGEDASKKGSSGQTYDVIIVGAGPAGMTTAIYTARDSISTLLLEQETAGGLAATTEPVENYPGFPEGIAGPDLMERFQKQARRFGAEFNEFEKVVKVEPVRKGLLNVHTDQENVYPARVVVVATGSKPKRINVPGEKELYGRGLSYCATCDGPLFRDKDVVVIGAGNSGLQEGANLLNYAKSVRFVEFLPYSPAEKILQDRVMDHPKATFFFNQQVTEIEGEDSVTGVTMKDRETGEVTTLGTDGVFIYVGYAPDTEFIKDLVEINRWGYIKTDEEMRTSVEGILATGDVRADNPAQISIAVGDGTRAAFTIREYLAELKEEKRYHAAEHP